MPKVKSNDWKHLQFNVFCNVFYNVFFIKYMFYVFYLQINGFNIYDFTPSTRLSLTVE